MRAIYINGGIDYDTINTFFADFNKLPADEDIIIYLSSWGGQSAMGEAVTDLINKNASRITLVACAYIGSAAFNIFFFSKCKRELMVNTVGMIHYARCSVELTEGNKPYTDEGVLDILELKRTAPTTIKQLKAIGLNAKELKLVKDGKDCYFTYPRLKQIFNAQKDRRKKSN